MTDAERRAPLELAVWRCAGCGRILAKHGDLIGTIQIKCGKCGTMNALTSR